MFAVDVVVVCSDVVAGGGLIVVVFVVVVIGEGVVVVVVVVFFVVNGGTFVLYFGLRGLSEEKQHHVINIACVYNRIERHTQYTSTRIAGAVYVSV